MVNPTSVLAFEAARSAQVLPSTAPDLLALLAARQQEVQALIEQGQLGAVYVPALLSKDVALALENHMHTLPDRQRLMAAQALKRVVATAFQLDAYGDLGNREQLLQVYSRYAGAIADLNAAYAPPR
jgi:hypothetical protein